ncbi:hypothetical protein MASR2M12_20820 [Bacteroidales bacterium]
METETKNSQILEEIKNLKTDTSTNDLIDDLDELFSLAMTNPEFFKLASERADNLRYSVRLIQKFLLKI